MVAGRIIRTVVLHDGQAQAVARDIGDDGTGAEAGAIDEIQGLIVRQRLSILGGQEASPDRRCFDLGQVNPAPIFLHPDLNPIPLQGGDGYCHPPSGRLARLRPGLRRLDPVVNGIPHQMDQGLLHRFQDLPVHFQVGPPRHPLDLLALFPG
jgi:hypothetical protein